jgi:hypothetical protein
VTPEDAYKGRSQRSLSGDGYLRQHHNVITKQHVRLSGLDAQVCDVCVCGRWVDLRARPHRLWLGITIERPGTTRVLLSGAEVGILQHHCTRPHKLEQELIEMLNL